MYANSRLLRGAFDAALAAADPAIWLTPEIDAMTPPRGDLRVLALGKSARRMAEVFADAWRGRFEGLVIAPLGQGGAPRGFEVMEAAHPVPDENSLAAGEAALALAAACRPDDRLLILLSGGASALACAPIKGVSLELKAELTRRLLNSGLSIDEVNTVRRAVSRLKGGGLVEAANGAEVWSLIQSDVPHDVLQIIGSGPGAPIWPDVESALHFIETVAPDLGPELKSAIERAAAGYREPPRSWGADILFGAGDGGEAAVNYLRGQGLAAEHWGQLEGDSGGAAIMHAEDLASHGPGGVVVTSGETTVAVGDDATGRGGRNLHFLLALAVELAGRRDVWALAADTDGVDGSSPAAGAWLDPGLLADLDVDAARAALEAFDSHDFFARQERLIETGPTGVNVGDLRLVLVA